jgi:hypothetical protein
MTMAPEIDGVRTAFTPRNSFAAPLGPCCVGFGLDHSILEPPGESLL